MSVTRLNTPNRPAGDLRLSGDSEIYNLGRGPETGFQRVRRLQMEARMLAREMGIFWIEQDTLLSGAVVHDTRAKLRAV